MGFDNYVKTDNPIPLQATGWDVGALYLWLDLDGIEITFEDNGNARIGLFDISWTLDPTKTNTVKLLQQYFDAFQLVSTLAMSIDEDVEDYGDYILLRFVYEMVEALSQKLILLPDDFRAKLERKTNATLARVSPRPGYVYLLQAITPTTHYKIGYSVNPVKRIESMGVKLPFPIEPLHLIPTNDTRKAEQQLHDAYTAKRVNGEWFSLTYNDVSAIRAIDTLYIEGVQS